jgi:transcriptional regulator GlxA family with amidase domain
MVHKVGIAVPQRVIPYDVAIACEVFGRLHDPDGRALYEVRVCGEAPEIRAPAFSLKPPFRLNALKWADTVILPGIDDPFAPISQHLLRALRLASKRGARIASVCTGSIILAAAGLLSGRRATTHWLCAERFAQQYPDISVDPNVLYVDEGQIITSAGASAGMDMCLHLVRRDFGQAVAAHAARLAVAPLDRDGGQSQFIQHAPPHSTGSLAPHLEWITSRLNRPLTVAKMAARARMSERTFARRFREQLGITPMQWLLKARLRRAQELLENSTAYVDQIATACGFQSTVTFRSSFRRMTGVSPASYRRRFKAA